jgi:F-type H+-transporting ATPase subunit b
MQSLEVISINLWQVIISLCNLLLLFLILKKFLFKPVKAVLDKRDEEIRERYEQAQSALDSAQEDKKQWDEKMLTARDEADGIVRRATVAAERRSQAILYSANNQADEIVRQARVEALQEKRKAQKSIKAEIVGLSSALTEKLLEREINEDDHRALIDEFLDNIGDAS